MLEQRSGGHEALSSPSIETVERSNFMSNEHTGDEQSSTLPGASDGLVFREKLFNEIWAEPMIVVAARYGVSGSPLQGL